MSNIIKTALERLAEMHGVAVELGFRHVGTAINNKEANRLASKYNKETRIIQDNNGLFQIFVQE